MSTGENSTTLTLEVSVGEALDKLSILEIKLSKITDHRKNDVQREYDALAPTLNAIIEKHQCQSVYQRLKKVNLEIWEKQDLLRNLDTDEETKIKFYMGIEEVNDCRFRVKSEINCLANSKLVEQKSYACFTEGVGRSPTVAKQR
jgi:hypothetical protein